MSQTQPRRSSQVYLLHGPILKSLLLFALPIMASRVFQQIYNTMDTLIVGYTLGDSSIAAMGACSSIYEMMTGFTFGVGNGLAIVTARCFGRQETDRMKKSVASCIVIGVAVTLVVTILATIFMHPLLRLLKTPAEILEESYSYISILSIFLFVMFAYNLCSGLLRAIGNSFMPLVFLILSSVLNVILDLWFIAVLGMGHLGQAITKYFNGKGLKLKITAAFDVDPEKVGKTIDGIPCYHMDTFENMVVNQDISIVIVSSPTKVAPSLVVPIINAGIKGVLNFTSTPLNFPQGIVVENYDITTLLEKGAYFVKENEESNSSNA